MTKKLPTERRSAGNHKEHLASDRTISFNDRWFLDSGVQFKGFQSNEFCAVVPKRHKNTVAVTEIYYET